MKPSRVRGKFSAVFGAVVLLAGSMLAESKSYYVSQSSGDDSATGLAENLPWKTLAKVAATNLAAGDRVMLKCGDTWNEELAPKGNGTPQNPIIIGYYDKGARPVIDRKDDKQDLVGIRLGDQEGYKIVGIEFAKCMTGSTRNTPTIARPRSSSGSRTAISTIR